MKEIEKAVKYLRHQTDRWAELATEEGLPHLLVVKRATMLTTIR